MCRLDGDFSRIWVQASLLSRAQEGPVLGLRLKAEPAFETWSSSIYQSGTVSLQFSRGPATVLSTRHVSSPLLFQAAGNSCDSPAVGHRPPAQMAQWQSWDSNPNRAFLFNPWALSLVPPTPLPYYLPALIDTSTSSPICLQPHPCPTA